MEEGPHVDAEGLVVAVHPGSGGGLASHAGAAGAGEHRADDLVAEREQGGDGAGSAGRDVVAAGLAGLDSKALPAELAQVVSGLPDRLAGLPGHGADSGGVLGDGAAQEMPSDCPRILRRPGAPLHHCITGSSPNTAQKLTFSLVPLNVTPREERLMIAHGAAGTWPSLGSRACWPGTIIRTPR